MEEGEVVKYRMTRREKIKAGNSYWAVCHAPLNKAVLIGGAATRLPQNRLFEHRGSFLRKACCS